MKEKRKGGVYVIENLNVTEVNPKFEIQKKRKRKGGEKDETKGGEDEIVGQMRSNKSKESQCNFGL